MFNFEPPRLRLVYGLFFIMISGCAGMKTILETDSAAPHRAIESTEAAPNTVLKSALQIKLDGMMNAPDPMQSIDIPLGLIKQYDQVKLLFKKDKTEQAIGLLTQLQRQHPKLSGPSYRLARLYYQQGDIAQALKAVENSLLINSQNYYSLNLKGVLLREKGEFEQAAKNYAQAIDVFPGYPKSHLNLAILSDLYLHQLDRALKHYQYYINLINVEDKKVAGWILDLERRMPKVE